MITGLQCRIELITGCLTDLVLKRNKSCKAFSLDVLSAFP